MTRAATLPAWVLCTLALAACREQGNKEQPGARAQAAPSATPSALVAPVASGLPGDLSAVSRAVNPKNERAYSGPTAAVEGTVTASGDPPGEQAQLLAKIGEECAAAKPFYGPVYRQGPGRTLADALVTVTGYQGYVPEVAPTLKLEARDCTWGTRTVAMTFGQSLEVVSRDKNSYVPELLGARMKSQLVATPFGKGVAKLFPHAAGRFVLIDNLRLFSTAEVLVLNYATHDVTALDGRYRIDGIPAGKVTVSAFLPHTGATQQREVELKAGDTLKLDFALGFDKAEYEASLSRTPAASTAASASAAPSAAVPAASAR